MKIFEVQTDVPVKDNEIRRMRQYVTADDDDFALVASHFKEHCYQYEEELISIAEVATVVQHIKKPEET